MYVCVCVSLCLPGSLTEVCDVSLPATLMSGPVHYLRLDLLRAVHVTHIASAPGRRLTGPPRTDIWLLTGLRPSSLSLDMLPATPVILNQFCVKPSLPWVCAPHSKT